MIWLTVCFVVMCGAMTYISFRLLEENRKLTAAALAPTGATYAAFVKDEREVPESTPRVPSPLGVDGF